ncbi:uncharacterized protein LOC126976734 isoform X2 [Leptidea sinapis]|uniref:uncharacterized protein LOC126976734 isoform X2 n=1 Tax=Leptidea sinapis TaxID=189913 RepID=UPI0021C434A2|nr:uncharacterized protein LOC126976734 isoform X2 [Leptidea sinapis]
MSGKPASVGAPPAGAASGRVLVYTNMGEASQLAAASPAPPAGHGYRPPYHSGCKHTEADQSYQNIPPTECFPFGKEPKIDDNEQQKRSSDWGIDRFQGIAESSGELNYQRCARSGEAMQMGVSVQNNSETVISDSLNCDETGKSYVNYQLLEQCVSHQSIVNQNVNILNHQVGVRPMSENEGGNTPQLVQTADGVVLAVLPSVIPQDTNGRTTQSEFPPGITVPLGWRRIVNGTSVLYISPSGTALSTLPQLREYLQTEGTCKCGLPCPLRPETAFSFDPKVSSKPYQAAAGAELTKLCNHKRKLLATLQARSTSPPHHDHKKGVETSKKKMKKRPGIATNMNVSQMMVQRDRPFAEFKPLEEQKRTSSPGSMIQRPVNMQTVSMPYPQQNMINVVQDEVKHEQTHVQRSSHYLTVSSGWISRHPENIDVNQKSNQSMLSTLNPALNIGLPVLGTNGQIIGVNTSFNKNMNVKNPVNIVPQNSVETERTGGERDAQQKQLKEDESQIFCGLNQPLTPEVMQRINEQQQIFIQRNQKQIEVMKGFKAHITENYHQNKQVMSNQFVPQGQLVIQNGAVVKSNSAKTPPWQVKRNESTISNPSSSPSPKLQKNYGNDYEMNAQIINEDASTIKTSFSQSEASNPGMCSRVPPLPQHYNIMGHQWPNQDLNKKKGRVNKSPKKKNSPVENKSMVFGNNGMKYLQEQKKPCDDFKANLPSFMEDPSGYLAQQTVLLNNTISRQVGSNSSYENNPYEASTSSYNVHHHGEKVHSNKTPKQCDINVFRNNMVTNSSPSPNTPDSSLVPEKVSDNVMSQCCKGCSIPYKGNCAEMSDNQMRKTYGKQKVYQRELDNPSTSSPKHGFDETPVISSTYDRNICNENFGPIQAGVVSTSNVSPTETVQPPEPSPSLSNSSRSTDTPHSHGSNNSQQNCSYPIPSPAYSNPGSCRDNFNSNPPTPTNTHGYHYNSPGPPHSQSISGTQMMHFISNHNVNKNLMEVDNISMVGVKPSLRPAQELYKLEQRKRIENMMPGYCPPPHLGGGPAHSLIQSNYIQTFVTTMASFSVIRDTVTSVLAGKANTATTSINASQANFVRLPPPPSMNLATTYAIPNNQPDPFINSVNLPTSYPLHIAGTTAQNMISKSPLEMVQNVISNLPAKPETSNNQSNLIPIGKRTHTTPGKILISSTGQILVSNNQMPPPPPKAITSMSQMGSSVVTNATSTVSQVVPSGGVQSIVNQQVVVNSLPTPFVLQPSMMTVDGQVVHQNNVMPHLLTGGIMSGQSSENTRQIDIKNGQNFVHGMAMLSPESLRKKSKKKKNQNTNITNVLQITAPQQNPNNIMVHSSPQHNTSSQFSPRGFQLSPTNNISPTPMLQALTIVPGKSGAPAHIVMNGQGNTNNFGSQQIITNSSPSQQINLLQPVNLINNASNVMSNFPAFQQFLLPNLGGIVMTADGATIIQDNSSGMPMQLQLQTVNGQNVLTPVQNPGMFTAGTNSGMVLRQSQQGKIIQSQHSPGAQFLSPNSQVMLNSPNFNGQLSPLLANLSPTSVTFNQTSQVRSGNAAQEFIQTNQIGQTLMVPLSPKQVSIPSASNARSNSTFVQQNTTIVQQQTTLVSNSNNTQMASLTTNLQGNASRINECNTLLTNKQMVNQKSRNYIQMRTENIEDRRDKHQSFVQLHANETDNKVDNSEGYAKFINDFSPLLGQDFNSHVRHSVSTQTLLNQQRGGKSPNNQAVSGSSPPDTTTHSPLGASETAASPRIYGTRCMSTQGNYADTTTKSPEPADVNSSGMVQCVSSSEQDMADSQERSWPTPRNDLSSDTDTHNNMLSNIQLMRQNRAHNPVESTEIQYNSNMATSPMSNQHLMPMASSMYDRQTFKRKSDFEIPYRNEKIMRSNYMIHGSKDQGFDSMDKNSRNYQGTSSETMHKVFDRHLGSGHGAES